MADVVTLTSKHSTGREPIVPELLVLHDTVGLMPGTYSWLMNPDARVSVHFLVTRTGKVYQMGKLSWSMWHAGESQYTMPDGRTLTSINAHSIGIELEHIPTTMGGGKPYTAAQLAALDRLVLEIYDACPTIKKTVGHREIAMPRGRKSDPELDPRHWEIDKVRERMNVGGNTVTFYKNPDVNLPPAAYGPGTTPLALSGSAAEGNKGWPSGDGNAGMVYTIRFDEAGNRVRQYNYAVGSPDLYFRDGTGAGKGWHGWHVLRATPVA